MRFLLLIFACLLAAPATAQVAYPPDPAVAAQAAQAANDAATALSTAQTAKTTADGAQTAALAACQPMATVPPVEVPGGTTGSGTNCRLANAADNRISRTGVFSYNSSGQVLCGGSSTCTWATPLPAGSASYPVFVTAVGSAATPSIRCKVTSSTNTGFTGMTCTQASGSIVLGGLVEITTGITPGTIFVLSLPSTQANQ
jgi:hypothetical protein